jgi:hypothetical protein
MPLTPAERMLAAEENHSRGIEAARHGADAIVERALKSHDKARRQAVSFKGLGFTMCAVQFLTL